MAKFSTIIRYYYQHDIFQGPLYSYGTNGTNGINPYSNTVVLLPPKIASDSNWLTEILKILLCNGACVDNLT